MVDVRNQISDLETIRSDFISIFDEIIKLDKSYTSSFKINLQKFDECLDHKDKMLIEKITQMHEELTRVGTNMRNLLCKAKSEEEIAQIYWSFKNELTKRSSEIEVMEKELNKNSRNQDREYYDIS